MEGRFITLKSVLVLVEQVIKFQVVGKLNSNKFFQDFGYRGQERYRAIVVAKITTAGLENGDSPTYFKSFGEDARSQAKIEDVG